MEHPSLETSLEDLELTTNTGAELGRDWVVHHAESLGYVTRPTDAGQSVRKEPLFVLNVNEQTFSWGADSVALTILMDVGTGIVGGAAWDGLKRIAKAMAARIQERNLDTYLPLTEKEAVERLRWQISERYSKSEQSLAVRAVETKPEGFIVEFVDTDGLLYEGEVVGEDGLVSVTRLRREVTLAE